jgi:hypothetical protein
MTEQEAKERAKSMGVRIRQLPCKAFHLIGNGVDVIVTDLRTLTEKDLQRYVPDDDLQPA